MSKHTPGPWHVYEREWGTVVEADDDYVVCGIRTPMWPADAQLIAAAPDMLDALQRVLAADLEAKPYQPARSLPPHLAKTIRAAIAKAEGES